MMPSLNNQEAACDVQSLSPKTCIGEVTEVELVPVDSPDGNLFPPRLRLCQYHHQLELMVWGIRTFFERYPLSAAGIREMAHPDKEQSGHAADWQAALAPIPDDSRLYFCLPDDLEFWLNRLTADPADRGYHLRPEYDHLKDISIDLGQIRLTDKQLMAVCMVFYGGVKKKRAAQAMNITSQALSDHIKAALKKIEDNIARH
ncbi:MAG: hypothetical protein E2O42_03595 [Nitrospina sp.]|nr:hypothetical protein [Nitrospinota bacterium]TDJ51193.1 MAG: hypothetical protein E2O43_06945 [Nitrospina sp.]TDJ60937.1 MAG: hypothetical protein E2O42_03595 [Nitrospina sp.]